MSEVYRCGFVGKDVGKTMTNTKKMVKWGLLINGERTVITVKHSIISHKKMIWYNDEVVKETKQLLSGDFDYTWAKEKHIFKVVIKKDNKGYAYSLFVDDVNFFDLPDFKKKDELETADIVNRLKNGPIVSTAQPEEEVEEEEEEEEEVEEPFEEEEEGEDEEDNEFFSNRGEENWLDFSAFASSGPTEEEKKKKEEEELKKKRVEEYTAGFVNLDFGL